MSAFSPQSSELGPVVIGGITILILVAAGFAALSNDLFESNSIASLNEERAVRISNQKAKISRLENDIVAQKGRLAEEVTQRESVKKAEVLWSQLKIEVESVEVKVADLQLDLSEKEEELKELAVEKTRYRNQVRSQLWSQYLNQALKGEDMSRGMSFRSPKIQKIDAAGLTVGHESGIARIGVAELSHDFREELMLDVVEARKVMADILIRDAIVKKSRTKRAAQAGEPTEAEVRGIIAQRLAKGKQDVDRYLSLIQVAEETARISRHNDRFSSSRSVPGSLETWEARAIRFQKAAGHYRIKLDEALTQVRTLEPSFKRPK